MPAASFDAFYPESWIPRVPTARLAPSTGTRTVIGPFQQDRRCPWDDEHRRRLLRGKRFLYNAPLCNVSARGGVGGILRPARHAVTTSVVSTGFYGGAVILT